MTGIYVASNVPAMNAQFQMQRNIGDLTSTMNRLSTGLKINSAKDDPAGLIASELLKSDITATTKAITNTQRANGMVSVATSALGQVTSLLNDVRGLVVESANTGALNESMIAANQLQIDASLDSIDRIARTTNYLGKKLLDGSLDYNTTGATGVTATNSQLSNVNITSANLGLASSLDVNVKVNGIAEKAQLFMNGTGVSEKTVVQIGGSKGTEAFSFGAGTSTSDMAKAISALSDATGVTARVDGTASRGIMTLSSAGMNNDIVVSSKTVGKDAGNYTFRIVENTTGNVDSAKILSSPVGDKAGVVEIALAAANVSSAKAVGGLFDVSTYTQNFGDKASILFQMGDKANVSLNATASQLNANESGIVSAAAQTNGVRTNTHNAGGNPLSVITALTGNIVGTNTTQIEIDPTKISGGQAAISVVNGLTFAFNTNGNAATITEPTYSYAGTTITITLGDATPLDLTDADIAGAIQGYLDSSAGVAALVAAGGVAGAAIDASAVSLTNGNIQFAADAADSNATFTRAAVVPPSITVDGNDMAHLLNGWTVKADDTKVNTVNGHFTDFENKTIFVNGAAATRAQQTSAMNSGIAEVVGAAGIAGNVTSTWAITGTVADSAGRGLVTGDSFKLSGAASADQLTVTYTSGMTAGQVTDMVNKSGLAQFQLSNVNNADTVMSNSLNNSLTVGSGAVSSYESSYTAGDLVKLLKSDLGSSFDFELLLNDTFGNTGSGRVSFMNAAVNYGDVNAGNAIQFKGTTESPAVRMVNTGAANQKLSFSIANAEPADIARGITGQILKINLATDAQGNSITKAKDIVNLFNTSTSAQTLGVSASLILPDGADPNQRVWGETICGLDTLDRSCEYVAGEGLVQATGWKEVCELVEYDMVFATQNQGFVYDNSSVNIGGTMSAAQGVGHTLRAPAVTAAVAALSTTSVGGATISTTAANVAGGLGQAGLDKLNSLIINFVDDTGLGATPQYSFSGNILTITSADSTAVSAANITTGINMWFNDPDGGNLAGASLTADVTLTGTFAANDTINFTGAGATQAKFASTGLQGAGFEATTSSATDGVVARAGLTVRTEDKDGATLQTNALNGITFAFTSNAKDAGFSVDSKTLTVYVDQATADRAKTHGTITTSTTANTFTSNTIAGTSGNPMGEINALVNAAIKDNWQEIATVNRASEKAGDVTVQMDAVITAQSLTTTAATIGYTFEFSRLLANASDNGNKVNVGTGAAAATSGTVGAPAGVFTGTAGNASNGKAVVIESLGTGVALSGVEISFIHDTNSSESANYDATNKRLTVTFNDAAGVLTAGKLVDLINNGNAASLFSAKLATGVNVNSNTAINTAASNNYKTTGGWYQGNNAANVLGNGENPNGVKMIGGTDDNQRLVLESTEMGSKQSIRVNVIAGKFATTDKLNAAADYSAGKDMVATVNGQATKADGNNLTLSTSMLQMSLTVDNSTIFNAGQKTSFTIEGGGAIFQTGPQVVSTQQTATGIKSMSTVNLGGISGKLYQLRTGESADMTTNTKLADLIVNEAISAVTSIAGRLGALQRSTFDPTIQALQNNLVALSDTEASISNADFAEESSKMARQQILVQTSARALAQLNQLPQYAQMLMG